MATEKGTATKYAFEMMDWMTDGLRTFCEAGKRNQDAMFKTIADACTPAPMFDEFFGRTERFARDFPPAMRKNVEVCAEAFDRTYRAGMETFNAMCDWTKTADEAKGTETQRRVWDSAFGMVRTAMDTATMAGTRFMENYASCCQFGDAAGGAAKPSAKPVK